MSILLRKKCQDTLESFGLGAYHVDLNSSKSLSIVAECGKPLVNIHGIRFNRTIPNEAEIEYASELLDNFMGTHTNLLKTYLQKEAEYKKYKLPDSDIYNADVTNKYHRQKGHVKVGVVEYDEGFFKHKLTYYFEDDEYIFKTSIDEDSLDKSFNLDKLTKFKADKTLFNSAKKYLSKFIEEDRLRNELSDLLTEVNKCDI